MHSFFVLFRECNKDTEAEERNSILQICKEVLLVGINDSNTDLSLTILNFWRSESRLPENSIERLIEILRALYSNKTEKDYLSYGTNLMMQLTSLSPDYSLPLFSMGLDTDKNFQNFKVNFSWQRQNASLTPLFVSSQHSSTAGTYIYTQGSQHEHIRATQNKFEFSQTHQVASSLDWMSPTIQVNNVFSLAVYFKSFFTIEKNDFFFEQLDKKVKSVKVVEKTFKKKN